MAGPTFKVLAALPWSTILKQAPAILAVAKGLQASVGQAPRPLRADADMAAVRERISGLEAAGQEHARAIAQVAEHLAALASAIDAAQRAARRAMLTGAAGLGVGILACLLAWLL